VEQRILDVDDHPSSGKARGTNMEPVTQPRKLGKSATFGGLVAGLLLLPLPVLAYSISPWTFAPSGINAISPNPDNKTLQYFIPGAGFGNAGNTATSTITQTGASPETANVFANLAGLNIRSGDLKITVTIGSQTVTTILTGNITSNNIPLGAFLVSGSQQVSIKFQFENASWTDSSTVNTIVFR
jgi:hypothetical protein